MRSHLLRGTVRHRRTGPITYQLRHDVWYIALDLDEVDDVTRRLRLLRRGRFGVLSFRDQDHWQPAATDLRTAVLDHLRARGASPDAWRITLIANLRVFGYVFDPASFYLCRDTTDTLRYVVVEVHNTYGERHLYTLRPEWHGSAHVAGMDKEFHVSPFMGMDARYTVRVQDDADRLRIAIVGQERGGPSLVATLDVRRKRLTDRQLLRSLVRVPLVTHKTTAAIHVHAWRLWRRGLVFRRHPGPAR